MFKAPEWSESFYDDIVSKCEKYISNGYWDDIDTIRFRNWLTNFKSKEENYFAACILDSLVYRTKKMVNSSIDEIAVTRIPCFLRSIEVENIDCTQTWLDRLRTGSNIPFRIIAIENVDGRTGKSGTILSRRVDERLHLARHLTRKLEQFDSLHQDVKAIVFVDNFAGTGEQFSEFIEKLKEKKLFNKYKYLYAPLAACTHALIHLKQKYPEIVIDPIEILTEEDSFFYPIEGYFQGDKINTIDDAKSFYISLCNKYGFGQSDFLLGKGDLALTFGFDFSTPNNNIKLLYHNPIDRSWKNLLVRRQ